MGGSVMASIINATTTGLTVTPDNSGQLTLSANGVTALTANTTGYLNFAKQPQINGVEWPAFHVYTSDSSGYLNNSTATKIRFNTKTFDTANCFDATTNYRFTPNVAGYYFFTVKILNNFGTPGQVITYVYKNGSTFSEVQQVSISQQGQGTAASTLIYANGTTDYFEVYYYQDKGSSLSVYTGQQQTYWTGFLARAA